MYQLEERDREIQEAKRQSAKLPQIAAKLYTAEQRIEKLEQLCRDLWTCAHEPKCCNCPKYQGENTDCEVLNAQRMDALGMLEVSHE